MSRATKSLLVGTLVFSILSAWTATDASATDDVIICIRYETEFDDWEMGDYYASSPPEEYNAVRPHVRVYDNDSQAVIYNTYTNDWGCTPTLHLNSTHDFQIKVYAESLLSDGNEIRVYDNAGNPVLHSQVLSASWNPLHDLTATMTYQYNGTYKVSNVLAAAGWAVNRRPAGLSNLDINYFTDPCPTIGGNCFSVNGGNHRIYLDWGLDYKSEVTHETGHEISYQKNDNEGSTNNCSFEGSGDCGQEDDEDCDGCHCNTCLEYQSCAAWEGFADFYSVVAWNNENDSDCDYNKNYDSCEDGGNLIEENSCCVECAGFGTESDWVHFWWDVLTDEEYSVSSLADIAQIYNLSDPEDWDDPEDVYPAMRWSAMNFGANMSNWDTWAEYNGVNH